MDEKDYVKKVSVHYYLLWGILVILFGSALFVINFLGSSWINNIPGYSAPIIAALVIVGMGVLLIVAWIQNLRRGIYQVQS